MCFSLKKSTSYLFFHLCVLSQWRKNLKFTRNNFTFTFLLLFPGITDQTSHCGQALVSGSSVWAQCGTIKYRIYMWCYRKLKNAWRYLEEKLMQDPLSKNKLCSDPCCALGSTPKLETNQVYVYAHTFWKLGQEFYNLFLFSILQSFFLCLFVTNCLSMVCILALSVTAIDSTLSHICTLDLLPSFMVLKQSRDLYPQSYLKNSSRNGATYMWNLKQNKTKSQFNRNRK